MAPSPLGPSIFAILLTVLTLLIGVASAVKEGYWMGKIDGQDYLVPDDRRPALYTKDYGDCMGESLINVTRFDAAYYRDNMTIVFHLGGETALTNETIMMYIGVFAYGESRFDLTFNPCSANIASACPIEAGTPVDASGVIPISQNDVAGIPSIALSIPDFEGQAILRIFSNSTQSQIGCYSGVITNGSSFSESTWVSSILGVFTFIAVLASFATAIYGENVTDMRQHYAHSFSVLVVFAVWQHIYFSGALSMNWPSVLVAFWGNYAWAGGIIYSEAMQKAINDFIGGNKGDVSHVGAAGTGVANPGLGGGFDIQKLYRRNEFPEGPDAPGLDDTLVNESRKLFTKRQVFEKLMNKREIADDTRTKSWFGHAVKPGLPLPGNYSGFAGTLAQSNIPASNAFMTGFLWFLLLLLAVTVSVMSFMVVVKAMSRLKMVKRTRLLYFRRHWLGYTLLAVFRTLFIAFYTLVFLTLFQLTYLKSSGPVAVACVVFLIVLLGLGGLVGYACYYRIRSGHYVSRPDRLNIEKTKLLKVFPWLGFARSRTSPRLRDKGCAGSIPWWWIGSTNERSIHNDEAYTKRFGWLTARFRRSRWWFFVVWFVYEFVRACFLAGALRSPLVQVFGLLVVEMVAFVMLVVLRPFESQRLNAIAVYFLSFSKITTLGLSASLDVRFGLSRILATIIGIVIIVIQGLLTIAVLVCIILGAISSYMSIMRHRDVFHPKRLGGIRGRYYSHLDFRGRDMARPPQVKPEASPEALVAEPEMPKEPYFTVSSVRRVAKVEDEDEEFMQEISRGNGSVSQMDLHHASRDSVNGTPVGHRRSPSMLSNTSYSSLPYGARVHRASWSTQDFAEHFDRMRARASSNPLQTPDGGNRSSRNGVPPLMARLSSGEGTIRQPSPLSAGITPMECPGRDEGDENGSARNRSHGRSRMSVGSRPQLQTLVSEGHVPTLSTSGVPMKEKKGNDD